MKILFTDKQETKETINSISALLRIIGNEQNNGTRMKGCFVDVSLMLISDILECISEDIPEDI